MAGTAGILSSCNDSTNDMTPQPQQGTFTVENVVQNKDFVQSGAFQGTGSATVQLPVVLPGQSISFKFNAGKGQRLMFATMYGASKDWFFAPENPGIKLYNDNGTPITGDISARSSFGTMAARITLPEILNRTQLLWFRMLMPPS